MWRSFAFGGRSEHEASLFTAPAAGETPYLSKKPPDTIRIEQAFRADGEVFLIAMLRDPRAVVTSRHSSKPGVYFRSFRHWRECAQAIRRLETHPRCLVVRFEDLVAGPDTVQAVIERRLDALATKAGDGYGLERRARFSDYPEGVEPGERAHRSLSGVRPLDSSRIAAWRDHLPRVRAQLDAHPDMVSWLVEFGYEPDSAWTAQLDGVSPHEQTYKERQPHVFKRWETALRYRRRTRAYLRERGLSGSAPSTR